MNHRAKAEPVSKKLLADHRFLEDQYDAVLEAARADDGRTLSMLWTDFETRLGAHMEGEERFIVAPLEAKHPQIVSRIRDEHRAIRELMATVGVSTDLHAVRLRSLEDLGVLLREHAAEEAKTIYELAAREIDCGPILRFLQSHAALLN